MVVPGDSPVPAQLSLKRYGFFLVLHRDGAVVWLSNALLLQLSLEVFEMLDLLANLAASCMPSKWWDVALLSWYLFRRELDFLLQLLKPFELGVRNFDAQLIQFALQLEDFLLNRDDAALFKNGVAILLTFHDTACLRVLDV